MWFRFCYLVIDFPGGSHGAPPARGAPLTYSGNSRCDAYYSRRRRGGDDGGPENYSSRRSDAPLSGRERGARRGLEVHPRWDRV